MPQRLLIRANAYRDSVSLMAVTQRVSELPGVTNCLVAMATEMNKELLQGIGLLSPEAAAATANDLVVAVDAASDAALAAAVAEAEAALASPAAGAGGASSGSAAAPQSLAAALRQAPGANLAFIATPGAFAAREARLALERGLHVMLYSDNVPVAEEVALKQLAHDRGLLLMGPDCGTAILDGVGLGFANAVRRGPIGIVAASGTGAQELSCLIHRLGGGVSHLIGVGGRDLSAAVGGRMTLDAIARLASDPDTRVIAVIAKPGDAAVQAQVAAALERSGKQFVLCLLGAGGGAPDAGDIDMVAAAAVAGVTGTPSSQLLAQIGHATPVQPLPVGAGRRCVRGLFSGGTLCEQALFTLEPRLGAITCNVHPNPDRRGGAKRSQGHTLVDLGDDEFTRGRPHPMIDPTLRRQRLQQEAADPETAVILLDIVLGYGSHPDPAGALAPAIAEAVRGGVAVACSLTGTEGDPQNLAAQAQKLRDAGAFVAPTAYRAALVAAATVTQ